MYPRPEAHLLSAGQRSFNVMYGLPPRYIAADIINHAAVMSTGRINPDMYGRRFGEIENEAPFR